MSVVGEVAGENAGSKGEDTWEYADLFGVGDGAIDDAIDHARCVAVNPRGEGSGFEIFLSLSVFGPEHVGDHRVDGVEPYTVKGLSFGEPCN